MNQIKVILFGILMILALLSCSPQVATKAPAGKSPVENIPVPAVKTGWEREWEITAREARKEGRLVVITTVGPTVRTALIKGFKDRFGVDIEFLSGTGREISEKLSSERKSGLYLADIYQGGVTTPVTLLKPAGIMGDIEQAFILPELKEPAEIKKTWFGEKLTWVDPPHKILAFTGFPQDIMSVNTNMVRPEEMKSYKDMLNPKWKGKIASFDLSMPGAGGYLFGVVGEKIMGMDFWREFARQDVFITRDHRQLAEWVARGKYAIAVAPKPEVIDDFIKEGAPLRTLTDPVEGAVLATGSGGLALLDRAPHPNAAKLFVNWLLTRETLATYTRAYAAQSLRLDVPTDFLPPERLRKSGVKYYFGDEEEFLLKLGGLFPQAREIFNIR